MANATLDLIKQPRLVAHAENNLIIGTEKGSIFLNVAGKTILSVDPDGKIRIFGEVVYVNEPAQETPAEVEEP